MAAQPIASSVASASACDCAPRPGELPAALFTARVADDSISPPLLGLTIDYETQKWRADRLAAHLLDWVADYALRRAERTHLSAGRAMEALRRAVWMTFGNGSDRGVPGELMLHIACRQFFGSDTVINKVVFKSATNDTYKGFDGVHTVHGPAGLELWLGEAKFYRDLGQAISSALDELEKHLATDYLRGEFALVADKIDDDHPHAAELRRLMHPNTSLDEVFECVTVPVVLTYDSDATAAHDHVCAEYLEAIEAEIRKGWLRFKNRLDVGIPVTIRLILVPLATKQVLLDALNKELAPWQRP